MNKSRFSFLPALVLTTVVLSSWTEHVAAQEIALTPLQATEVAKGYRADALRLIPVVNDQTIRSGGSPISFLGMMAAFSLFLPSAILPDLTASSSPFPSVASNWTIPPATLYCREQVARRWKNCQFSSPVDEPVAL